jgi:Effector Associated Constant Component 1
MDLYVRLAEPDMDAMIELAHWLAYEDRIPADSREASPAGPVDGALGTTTEVLQLAVGSAIALGQLVLSIAQWRQSRHQPPRVMISAERPDGVTVTIETTDPQALAEAVRQLGEL